jgi:hypothetical protein
VTQAACRCGRLDGVTTRALADAVDGLHIEDVDPAAQYCIRLAARRTEGSFPDEYADCPCPPPPFPPADVVAACGATDPLNLPDAAEQEDGILLPVWCPDDGAPYWDCVEHPD